MEVALLYDPIHTNIINYETLEYPKTKNMSLFNTPRDPRGTSPNRTTH